MKMGMIITIIIIRSTTRFNPCLIFVLSISITFIQSSNFQNYSTPLPPFSQVSYLFHVGKIAMSLFCVRSVCLCLVSIRHPSLLHSLLTSFTSHPIASIAVDRKWKHHSNRKKNHICCYRIILINRFNRGNWNRPFLWQCPIKREKGSRRLWLLSLYSTGWSTKQWWRKEEPERVCFSNSPRFHCL